MEALLAAFSLNQLASAVQLFLHLALISSMTKSAVLSSGCVSASRTLSALSERGLHMVRRSDYIFSPVVIIRP